MIPYLIWLLEVDQVNIFGSYPQRAQKRRLHAVGKYFGFPQRILNFTVSRFCFRGSLDYHCLGVHCLGLDSSMSDYIVAELAPNEEHETNE